jgi:hypothetical protein
MIRRLPIDRTEPGPGLGNFAHQAPLIGNGHDFGKIDAGVAEQPSDCNGCRPRIDIFGSGDLREMPVNQDRDPIRDCHRFAIVLRDIENRGGTAAQQVRKLKPHLVAKLGVDVAERIVQQQHLRISDQGTRERCALLLPVRQLARHVAENVLDLQQPTDRSDPCGHLSASGFRAQPARDVVLRRHVGKQGKVLKGHADPAPFRRRTDNGPTADQDIPVVRLEHASDHAQQHGLAAARGPEYCDDFARLDRQGQVIRTADRTECLADGVEFETRHVVSLSPRRATAPRPGSAAHRAPAARSASPRARSQRRSGRIGCRRP